MELYGYFDNSKLSNIQYRAYIKYNFVANTDYEIYARSSSGGLIGVVASKLNYNEEDDEEDAKYNNVECNLVAADVRSEDKYIDMGIAAIGNSSYLGVTQSSYMNSTYVYNCSTLNGVQVGGIEEEKESYIMVNSSGLSTSNVYTATNCLNFGTGRYDYTNNYFPTLKIKYSNVESYWGVLGVTQTKIPIPTRIEEFSDTSVTSLEALSAMSVSLYSLRSTSSELPKMYVYASDVDKINIEFSSIDASTSFVVTANGETVIEKTPITEQVYTLEYDYKTPIQIRLSNANYSKTEEIKAGDVQNLLSIIQDEYIYLKDNKLYSSKTTIDGEFVNIYKNKALDSSGIIYEIPTKEVLSEGMIEIKQLAELIPITQTQYDGKTIQTFAHCSKVIEDEENYTYKTQQIFVKNGNIYVIDGKLESKCGAVIIDSYNEKQYETILGTDGVMYDLLTEINYPTDFENKDIIAITNNVDSDTNVILVYYSNGRVYGFNYITGEEVYDNSVKKEIGLMEYVVSNFSLARISYSINKASYVEAEELIDKLETVSVDEAIEEINQKEINIEIDVTGDESDSTEKINIDVTSDGENNGEIDDIKIEGNNTSDTKEKTNELTYIPTYDSKSQSYVVYSTAELLNTDTEETQTENEKIRSNSDLISYYSNLSTGTLDVQNIGTIVIALILGTICVTLILLYKKSNK